MSECAIDLFNSAIPRDSALPMTLMSDDEQQRCVLTGGDDYELCFTASPDYRQQLAQLSERHAPAISRIGRVREGRGVVVLDEHGESIEVKNSGYRHFQMSGN